MRGTRRHLKMHAIAATCPPCFLPPTQANMSFMKLLTLHANTAAPASFLTCPYDFLPLQVSAAVEVRTPGTTLSTATP